MDVGRVVVKKLVSGYRAKLERKKKEEIPELMAGKIIVIGGDTAIKEGFWEKFRERKRGEEEEKEMEEEEAKKETIAIEIPVVEVKRVKTAKVKAVEEEERIAMRYPLIPKKPARNQPIFAYANIFWDRSSNRYVYQLVEPQLSSKLANLLIKIKELLEERLDVDFTKLKRFEAKEYLNKEVTELISYFGFKLSSTERQILRYYIERDFIGLGKIEPFVQDDQIEDISCDGVGIPLFVFHRDARLGSVATNIVYASPEQLDSFITRLAQVCGKSISVAEPLLGGSLPDGSRVQATLATDIARRGSNFTIRKFTKTPLTPVHLLNYGTIDVKALAYLWLLVDYGSSIIVSGGTASGKTSLLNVLSLFIRPEKKIISIEDTAELQLPHPHWVPAVARVSISREGAPPSEVDLFDLLKESFRQRPDYIIVGEVRGREAYILFQQMATGHPSLATIHSEDMPKLIDRLTTPPISLPPRLIGSLDLVVFLAGMKYRDKFVRRVVEIIEMIEYDPESDRPRTTTLFKWNPIKDSFDVVGKSIKMKKVARRAGIKDEELVEELKRRMIVLKWLKDNNIVNYEDVHKAVNTYYNYPRRTLAMMMGES